MYILLITRGYPSLKWPMNGLFEFDQAKALNNLGHKIVIASIDLRSIRRWRNWGSNYSVINGIEIYDVSIPLGRLPWKILFTFGRQGLLYLFRRILTENGRPDIAHAHFAEIGAIACILKKKYNLPFVITEHSNTINRNVISRQTKSIGKTAYQHADKIISVSLALSKKIKQHFNFDNIVVHNIADSSSFSYKKKAQKNNKFTFISVGNLIDGKGFDLLIEAFYQAKFSKNVYLFIVGEGRLKKWLQNKVSALGLSDQVKLTGRMNRSEISQMMQKSDVFVLASRSETFGVVYIEAMLTGLPVIATRCGGPEEYVNENNGILIPVDNVDLLVKAMIYMCNHINKYNQETISQQCWNEFSPERIANRLYQIYCDVLNNKCANQI